VMSLGMREEGGGIDNSQQLCLTCKVSPCNCQCSKKKLYDPRWVGRVHSGAVG